MAVGILFLFPAVFYVVLVWRWTSALKRPISTYRSEGILSVSVVVAFRNEGKKTSQLLEQLEQQVIPKHLTLECLFVDDHSNDDGAALLRQTMAKTTCNARMITAKGKGKKAAQMTGVLEAQSDLILTLDVDVLLHPKWLSTMVNTHLTNGWAYTAATVIPLPSHTRIGKLTSLEFLSLQAATEGSFAIGRPFMSNGANSAFYRHAWHDAKQLRTDQSIASGDDVFLVQALQKLKMPMGHAAHPDAVVFTQMPEHLSDVLIQRTRWAAKTTHYTSRYAQLVAIVVALLALFQLLGWIFSPYLWGLVWISKTIVDVEILKTMGRKYDIPTPMRYCLVLAVIYPFYTLLIVMLTLLSPLFQQPNKQWK